MVLLYLLLALLAAVLVSFIVGYVNEPWGRSDRVQAAELGAIVGVVAILGILSYAIWSGVHDHTVVAWTQHF